ncbi:MAG TPA: methionyl-tRNA formyltransferase [Casimicrobiaceae bacterium]|nr:methionyl-tRNA formyltransferase [Casimicrobiaceae bacterium]
MNVGFAGTPAFAATVLAGLLDAGFAVPLVLTQPDRPRGRGLRHEPSPVKRLALEHGVRVEQPPTLTAEVAREMLAAAHLDVLAVAAYGLLLPPPILAMPREGCINVHASLLPRWRGAAPIQRALLAGDNVTGVTIMQMDAGLDTGPIIDAVRVTIDARETAGTLETKLAASGMRALTNILMRIVAGEPVPRTPQPASGAALAPKVRAGEAAVDWSASAVVIDRQIRAFDPAPGAYASFEGRLVKLWAAEPASLAAGAPPGAVVDIEGTSVLVACGTGALKLGELQPAGARRMPAAAFLAGRRAGRGARFGDGAATAG